MDNQKLRPVLFFMLAAVFAGSPGIVLADETTEALDKAADEYNKKQESDRRRVVCRREARTGTRIKTKVCRSVASMERDAEDARRLMDRARGSVGEQN